MSEEQKPVSTEEEREALAWADWHKEQNDKDNGPAASSLPGVLARALRQAREKLAEARDAAYAQGVEATEARAVKRITELEEENRLVSEQRDAMAAKLDAAEAKLAEAKPSCVPACQDAWIFQKTRAERAEAFKAWTHDYLDKKGVPATIDDGHLAAGCRIGGRMDWVFAKLAEAERQLKLERLPRPCHAGDCVHLIEETAKRERAEAERDEALKPHEAFLAGYKKNWEDAMDSHRKLFQKNSSLSVAFDKALKEREELEDRIGDIAVAIGLDESERQWSNLNDPIQNIIERAEAAESRALALEQSAACDLNTIRMLSDESRTLSEQLAAQSALLERAREALYVLRKMAGVSAKEGRQPLKDACAKADVVLAQLPVTPAPVEEKKP